MLSGGNPSADTTSSVSSQSRDDCQLATVINAPRTVRFPVSVYFNASGHHWTVFWQDRAAAACTCIERNGVWQTMKCVPAATFRRCHISLIPACWPNSTVVYNIYTLQSCCWLADIIWHVGLKAYETLHYISLRCLPFGLWQLSILKSSLRNVFPPTM